MTSADHAPSGSGYFSTFVGRTADLAQFTELRQQSLAAEQVSAVLLTGEAGIGKSSLIRQIIAVAQQEHWVAVHLVCYPDTNLDLLARLAYAVTADPHAALLVPPPDGVLPNIAATLRRLIRLRPTLLVLEDLHHLTHENCGLLLELVGAIAEESFLLIGATRPGAFYCHTVLAPLFSIRRDLLGLSATETTELTESMVGNIDPDIITAIHKATKGNPFVLRLALQQLMATSTTTTSASVLWFDRRLVEITVQQSVNQMITGMMARLPDEDQIALRVLSLLGEVFCEQAAKQLLSSNDAVLERLCSAGFLHRLPMQWPVLSEVMEQETPLAFTHSLLYDECLRSAATPTGIYALFKMLAAMVPLFSTKPITLLLQHQALLNPNDVIDELVRLLPLVDSLRETTHHNLCEPIIELIQHLAQQLPQLSSDQQRLIRLWVLGQRTLSHKINNRLQATATTGLEYFNESATLSTPAIAAEHLTALSVQVVLCLFATDNHQIPVWKLSFHEIWQRGELVVGTFPELRYTKVWVQFLTALGQSPLTYTMEWISVIIAQEYQQLTSDPTVLRPLQRYARYHLGPVLLRRHHSEEQFKERLQLLQELDAITAVDPTANNWSMMSEKGFLLWFDGRFKELALYRPQLMKWLDEHGYNAQKQLEALLNIIYTCAFADEPDAIEEQTVQQVLVIAQQFHHRRGMSAHYLVHIGILRNNAAWVRRIYEKTGIDIMLPNQFLAREALDGTASWTLEEVCSATSWHTCANLQKFVRSDQPTDYDGIIATATVALTGPLYMMWDVFALLFAVDILLLVERQEHLQQQAVAMRPQLCTTIQRVFDWMQKRDLYGFMQSLIDRYGWLLPSKDANARTTVIETIRKQDYERREQEHPLEGTISIGMIDEITFGNNQHPLQRLQGNAVRTLLGLLVLNQMPRVALSREDFQDMLSGGESEHTQAAGLLRVTLFRLRGHLGHEAIITKGHLPELNMQIVRVDLLQAIQAAEQGLTAARTGRVRHAIELTTTALQVIGGRVAFPALYHDIFESARAEVEVRLRRAVLASAQLALHEGDIDAAITLLISAVNAWPEDDELVGLLVTNLRTAGRFIQATQLEVKARRTQAA